MYGKLNELYQKTRLDIFVMAMSYIIDKGYETVKAITDDDIATIKGNPMMTEDFCKDLVKLAREICMTAENGIELYQFADAKGLFEVSYYTNGEVFERDTLEKVARKMLEYSIYTDFDVPNDEEGRKEELSGYLDIEVEDIDRLLEY